MRKTLALLSLIIATATLSNTVTYAASLSVPVADAAACTTPATAPAAAVKPTISRDIPYSALKPVAVKGSSTTLDVYAMNDGKTHPILMFVHGGGWEIGDKGNQLAKPEAFVRAGYVYLSINYRLVPEVMFPQNVQDVGDAIGWTYKNIAKYGGDPNCITIMGHSAGAHLVALVGTDEAYLKPHGLTLAAIKGVITLDTASYDIPAVLAGKYGKKSDDAYAPMFGTDPATWKAGSPIAHISAGKSIPPFLVVYVARRPDSKAASEDFEAALKTASVSVGLYPAQNKTHETLNKELGTPGDAPTARVMEFLKTNGAK
jgi:acetyl esterase/lipase